MGVRVGVGGGENVGEGEGEGEAQRFARLMRELKGRAGLSYGLLARKLHTSTSTLHRYCNGEAVPTEFAVVDRFARLCGASAAEAVELHRAWLLADARRRAAARAAAPVAAPPVAGEVRTAPAPGAPEPAPGTAAPASAAPEPVGGPIAGPGAGRGGESEAGRGAEPAAGAAVESGAGPVAEPTGATGAPGAEVGTGRAAGTPTRTGPAPVAGPARVDVPEPGRLPWYRRRGAAVAVAGAAAGAVAVAVLTAALPEGGTPSAGAGPRASAAATGSSPAGTGTPATPTPTPATGSPSAPASAPASASASPSAPGQVPAPPPGTEPGTGPGGGPATAAPLRAAVRSHVWAYGCDHAYLAEQGPGALPPPPLEADAPAWASSQRAVHAGTQIVEITLHGTGPGAVVLEDLEVRVAARRTPPAWNVYEMSQGCGGAITPAGFAVNLDASRPLARPVAGNDAGAAVPAPSFPLRVSAAEPVVLRVEAATKACDCDWVLDLRWTGPSGSGTLRVDDNGRPLRTSATTGRPVYGYATEQGRWAR
ncbi:helix-turn-helix transcriptional regulator [Streptomyces sp. NBC_01408]|uniref:helix-turn-helix domain-containing protein n=1 Tax=Streptomyces sp. NBC_01408 TaxID=2903855 RepID=UPI00225B22C6|nr:transcriptional regulator [Streptomyces sp. NBC_01408]MCX4693952.1 helix-turn-helix domain-containing protein [Streptomyces sp. NBC_01408]